MNDPFVSEIRKTAASLLPPGAFLKRDRDHALFITNAPRIVPGRNWAEILSEAGFYAEENSGLIRLTPGSEWLSRLEKDYPEPPDFLCRSLMRFRGEAHEGETLALFSLGLRILDGDNAPGYEQRLRKHAAVCLRSGGGGGLYACAILNSLMKRSANP
ncbi:MAG: hypothetical protein IKM02_06490 [Clostridia bacterium]|nr:hypothetical protein [Clostridia bacterium]